MPAGPLPAVNGSSLEVLVLPGNEGLCGPVRPAACCVALHCQYSQAACQPPRSATRQDAYRLPCCWADNPGAACPGLRQHRTRARWQCDAAACGCLAGLPCRAGSVRTLAAGSLRCKLSFRLGLSSCARSEFAAPGAKAGTLGSQQGCPWRLSSGGAFDRATQAPATSLNLMQLKANAAPSGEDRRGIRRRCCPCWPARARPDTPQASWALLTTANSL